RRGEPGAALHRVRVRRPWVGAGVRPRAFRRPSGTDPSGGVIMDKRRFGERLAEALDKRGPLCVGLDPHPSLLRDWGLPDDPYGLAEFGRTVVEALAERVPVIKPQSAFYERFGSQGIAVLESTIRQLREAGALVLLDVKRGDIGSTAAAYADAYLDPGSPLRVDAVTASPYLGFGSLRPMIDKALAHGAGVFV